MSVGLLEKLTQTPGRVSLPGLLTVLTGVAALVFAIIAVFATSRSIPSEIALGCALAFVASASTSSIAAKKARAKRREAYERFLTSSDRLVEAHESLRPKQRDFENARGELDIAEKKVASSGNAANQHAAIEAQKRLTVAKDTFTSADDDVTDWQNKYDAAKQKAGQLARDSVRAAFEAFGSCPPQNTPDRDRARSAFVKVARHDVKIRARTDVSTL